jgi:hypothetical protein
MISACDSEFISESSTPLRHCKSNNKKSISMTKINDNFNDKNQFQWQWQFQWQKSIIMVTSTKKLLSIPPQPTSYFLPKP